MGRRIIWVVWPGFFMAIPAVGVVFSLFDPEDLHFFGVVPDMSKLGIYTIGFFAIWIFGACCSALTCLLQRSAPEINQKRGL